MEHLEWVLGVIVLTVGLGVGTKNLWSGFKETVKKAVSEQFGEVKDLIDDIRKSVDSLDKRIDDLDQRIDKVNMQGCKNFLVRCIADFENEQPNNETELERFWEQYDYYVGHGENSYVRRKVEQLEAQGKIKRIPAK